MRSVRRNRSVLVLLLTTLALGAVVSGQIAAASGKGRASKQPGSLDLVVMDNAVAPSYGGRVTFLVASTAEQPFVGVRCWQGASFVYDAYAGYFDAAWFERWFTLDSLYWEPGSAANCTARLFAYDRRGNERIQATLDFAVHPA
jgi:hypothetical protein